MISVPKSEELMIPILYYAREREHKFNVRWTFNFLLNELDLPRDVF